MKFKVFNLFKKAPIQFEPSADDQALRAMTASRDDWKTSSQSWEDKFKKAVTDLAAARDEGNDAKLHIDHLGITFNQRLADAVQDYEADALAMRRKRQMDRNRIRPSRAKSPAKAGKKESV